MNRSKKLVIITTFILVTVSVLGARDPQRFLMAAGLIGLLILVLRYRQPIITGGLAISLLFLYTGPTTGWLYGRDSHSAIAVTEDIVANGWEVKHFLAPSAVPETPALHILTAILHILTGVAIRPGVDGRFLLPALLPLIFVGVIYLLSYAVTKRAAVGSSVLAVLPVLLWFPLLEGRTAFRRQSLGLLLFGLFVFLSYRHYKSQGSKKFASPLIIIAVTVPFAHQTAAILSFVYVAVYSIAMGIDPDWPIKMETPPLRALVPAIAGVVMVTWYFYFWNGGSLLLTVFTRVPEILGGAAGGGAGSEVAPTSLSVIRFDYAKWGYQVLLAAPILGLTAVGLLRRQIDRWQLVTIAFGAMVGIFALVSHQTGIFDFDRLMTYFVVSGGIFMIPALSKLIKMEKIPSETVPVALIVLALLSAVAVPGYVVTGGDPTYSEGMTGQRFGSQQYAVSEFSGEYADFNPVLVDAFEGGPLMALNGVPGTHNLKFIRNSSIPKNGAVVLTQRNDYIFVAESDGEYVIIKSQNLRYRYDRKAHRVYESGGTTIHINGTS